MSTDKTLIVIAGGGIAQVESAVGCLMVLERRGVDLHSPRIDWRGTSAGAIVASLIASGAFTADRCATFLAGLESEDLVERRWFWPFRLLVGGHTHSREGAEALIRKRLGDRTLRNVTVICTRTAGMRRIDLPAHAASVLASFAIDGVFPPVRIGDELLLDGGYVDNVPLEPWRIAEYRRTYLILPPKDVDHDRHARTFIGRLLHGFDAKISQETEEADRIYDTVHYPSLTKLRPPPVRSSLLALSPDREVMVHAAEYAARELRDRG